MKRPTAARGRRVLVVDDNQDAADSLGTLLQLLGAAVQVVYEGRAALKAIAQAGAETVFLDIGMPGMDGYEVAPVGVDELTRVLERPQ